MQPFKLLNEAESPTFARLILKNFGKFVHVVSEKIAKVYQKVTSLTSASICLQV